MKFNKLTLDCIIALELFFRDNQCRICDCTVGGTFMWRDFHNTEYAIADETLYLKVSRPEPAFAPPRGVGVGRESFERIRDYCAATGMPAQLCSVSKPVLKCILKMYPESRVWTDRVWSDYLYLSDDIVNLTGRKFSGQRNHINRFMREHPAWSFERVTEDNNADAMAFIGRFEQEYDSISPTYVEASRKALEVLDNLDLYGQFAGILYANGAIVGVSLGETVRDTLYVHAEKADTDYHGAYPMLVNQFARMFATEGIKYINREEDDGIEGLRTSKLSYHPTTLLEKYMVELK